MMRAQVGFAFGLAVSLSACSGGGSGSPDVAPGMRCIPGMSVTCACVSGGTGAQVCAADGTYGTCTCGSPDVMPATDASGETGDSAMDVSMFDASRQDGASDVASNDGIASDVPMDVPSGGDALDTTDVSADGLDAPVTDVADVVLDVPMDSTSGGDALDTTDVSADGPDAPVTDISEVALDVPIDTGCPPPGTTVYADGSLSPSAAAIGNGSLACPVRSITQGLAIAGGSTAVTSVQIAGASGGTPIVYSGIDTGEIFPLVPSAGLTITGAGAAQVTIHGGGTASSCGTTSACAMLVTGALTLSNVTIENDNASGDGIAIASGGALTLTDTTVSNCGRYGVMVQDGAMLTATAVVALSNGTAGLDIEGIGTATTTNSTFSRNGGSAPAGGGVLINGGGMNNWSSNSDTISNNIGDGVQVDAFSGISSIYVSGNNDPTCTATSCSCTSTGCCNIFGNTANGIAAVGIASVFLSRCVVLGNGGSGVSLNSMAWANAGGGSYPGHNVLQATSGGNGGAGICFNDSCTPPVGAQNDHWAHCPPTITSACTGGVDVGGGCAVFGGGGVDTTGCMTP